MHNKTDIYPSVIDVVVDSKLSYFKQSMETLKKQTVINFEFIIVIGYPGTETNAYLDTQEFPFEVIRIQEPQRESYPARASANNLGLDAATGDIYIGTQDDILYPENWIESHIEWQSRDDGPWFVYNMLRGVLGEVDADAENEYWERMLDPRNVPIVDRWKYASGHGFCLPMKIAKTLRHDERYNGAWGYEDIDHAFQCHKAGCKFAINTDVPIIHQNHGDRSDQRWARDPNEFWRWLTERCRNRRLFYEIHGFEPETGVQRDGFGLPGDFIY